MLQKHKFHNVSQGFFMLYDVVDNSKWWMHNIHNEKVIIIICLLIYFSCHKDN